MDAAEVEAQVEGFIARYDDAIAAEIRAARAIMRARLPGALELVWDGLQYAGDRVWPGRAASRHPVLHRRLSLLDQPVPGRRTGLNDPHGLLKGEGSRVLHIVLEAAERLNDPEVAGLMDQIPGNARTPLDPAQLQRTIVKSISTKQRPRRK